MESLNGSLTQRVYSEMLSELMVLEAEENPTPEMLKRIKEIKKKLEL